MLVVIVMQLPMEMAHMVLLKVVALALVKVHGKMELVVVLVTLMVLLLQLQTEVAEVVVHLATTLEQVVMAVMAS